MAGPAGTKQKLKAVQTGPATTLFMYKLFRNESEGGVERDF
jgi:hypothetical protein